MLGDSTVFILDGYPEEVGTYTCRTNNSFGEDFKHFSVDYSEEQDDNTWKDHLTIAIIVTIVLLLLAGINITFYLRKERKVFNVIIQKVITDPLQIRIIEGGT